MHDNYGPVMWNGTGERWDWLQLKETDTPGSGGDKLRQKMKKFMGDPNALEIPELGRLHLVATLSHQKLVLLLLHQPNKLMSSSPVLLINQVKVEDNLFLLLVKGDNRKYLHKVMTLLMFPLLMVPTLVL